ncbi:MAG: DUF1566 domain-containing protein [Candidatus Thiodiazotropha sp. (ex Ctena orbiculata)]|nr:DUF1566 domain-containing protein [Candidatus Thiodiazotropha taylori]
MGVKSWYLSIALLCTSLFAAHSQAALIDQGGGLIYDTVLDITWLQDASSYKVTYENGEQDAGKLNYNDASAWVDSLIYEDSVRGVVYDDWRLPTTFTPQQGTWYDETGLSSELAYMYYVNLGYPAIIAEAGQDPAEIPNPTSSNYNPFDNLQYRGYWSETTVAGNDQMAYFLHFHLGIQGATSVDGDELRVWAVRDGNVTAVPAPPALLLLLSGLVMMRFFKRNNTMAES